MVVSRKNTEFLNNVIFEIDQVCKVSSAPLWADGSVPIKHHVLIYMARGEGKIIINGVSFKLERDSIFLYCPGTLLELQLKKSAHTELYWMNYDLYRLSNQTSLIKTYHVENNFPIQGRIRMSGSKFKRHFYLFVAEGKVMGERDRFLLQHNLYEMLEALIEHDSSEGIEELEVRLKFTVDYLLDHYREDIRIEKLAELAKLHPSYYSQVFKQSMDKTPVVYLTHLRMNKAKEMLYITDKSVNDIAADVGYADEFYFSRRFKETSGYSPRVYTSKTDLRIISLSAPYTDQLMTLGIEPCAAQTHSFMPLVPHDLYLPKHASEPWRISRQIFIDSQPDLIVCKDNVIDKAREHINDIAPIIAIPWKTKDIYTHLMDIAEIVNKEREAQNWLIEHECKSELIRKKIHSQIGSATVTMCVANGNELRIYGARNIGHVVYRSLRMTPPESLQRHMEAFPIGTGFTWIAITPEELSHYESDFLFFVVNNDLDKQRILQSMRTLSAWKQLPAVVNKRVYFLERSKWIVYAPIVISQQLEEIGQIFANSAAL